MKFRLNISITFDDYCKFNEFQALRHPFGKKQILKNRIVTVTALCGLAFLSIMVEGFTAEAFLTRIPLFVAVGVFAFFIPKIIMLMLRQQLKSMKKQGKLGYSPEAVMEFYDDYFVETTPDNKTEQKYTSVENVFAVDGKYVYIFINNLMAYIIPRSSFESVGQYNDFLSFLEARCGQVNYY